jgi:ankyrin repeat protein
VYLVLNDGEQDGDTPLTLAAKKGHHKRISILVSRGADVNAEDKVVESVFLAWRLNLDMQSSMSYALQD